MNLTRRQCLALSGLYAARNAFAQTNVEEEIRGFAEHAPLSMQFHGSTAADCRRWQQQFSTELGKLLGPYEPPSRW